jgi:hypothetical protein
MAKPSDLIDRSLAAASSSLIFRRGFTATSSSQRGGRLGAGEYPAFELRTPDVTLGLGQRVRIETGWVEAESDEAYLECR